MSSTRWKFRISSFAFLAIGGCAGVLLIRRMRHTRRRDCNSPTGSVTQHPMSTDARFNLDLIPDEIAQQICSFLGARDLARLSSANSRFNWACRGRALRLTGWPLIAALPGNEYVADVCELRILKFLWERPTVLNRQLRLVHDVRSAFKIHAIAVMLIMSVIENLGTDLARALKRTSLQAKGAIELLIDTSFDVGKSLLGGLALLLWRWHRRRQSQSQGEIVRNRVWRGEHDDEAWMILQSYQALALCMVPDDLAIQREERGSIYFETQLDPTRQEEGALVVGIRTDQNLLFAYVSVGRVIIESTMVEDAPQARMGDIVGCGYCEHNHMLAIVFNGHVIRRIDLTQHFNGERGFHLFIGMYSGMKVNMNFGWQPFSLHHRAAASLFSES